MKTRFDIMLLTSRVALIAVTLSSAVYAAAFLKLGDIKGESFKEVPPETECYAMADGKYQCKSPKANAPIVMQCNKSVRLSKAMKFSEVAKKYPQECGIWVPDGHPYGE